MTGYIYAAGSENLVKIGYSETPEIKSGKIKIDTPFVCSVLGYIEGTLEQEAELHSLLANEWVNGKWYQRGTLTDHFISRLKPLSPIGNQVDARRLSSRELVEEALSIFGTEGKLAAAAGVSQPVVHEAKRTGKVGPYLAIGIDRATSGEISKSDLRPDLWPHKSRDSVLS